MVIDCTSKDHKDINTAIRKSDSPCRLTNCLGQRFIGAGMDNTDIDIEGIPGNALGAYFNGGTIHVHGNAQDSVGDTMNDGTLIIDGNVGDCPGYAMRGGKIFVRGNAGYRVGIHMKAYKEKKPIIIIGERTGSFLGEYMAGGIIVVLGLNPSGQPVISNYSGVGMHGGKMFIRSLCKDIVFPAQVSAHRATSEDMAEIQGDLKVYCEAFDLSYEDVMASAFTCITPNSSNPYQQLYAAN